MSTRGLKPSPYRVFLHESGRYPIRGEGQGPPRRPGRSEQDPRPRLKRTEPPVLSHSRLRRQAAASGVRRDALEAERGDDEDELLRERLRRPGQLS